MASKRFDGILKSLAMMTETEGVTKTEQRKNGMIIALAESRTRRGALRLLAGAALAGGIGASGRAETQAKKGKSRCRTGRIVSSHSIQDVNTRYKTSVLAKGRLYRIRVSGYLRTGPMDPGGPYGPILPALDAEYAFDAAHPNAYNDRDTETSAGTDYGLTIDGKKPNWGPYQPDRHAYERTIKGRGRAISLLLQAHRGSIGSRSTMVVEISCA